MDRASVVHPDVSGLITLSAGLLESLPRVHQKVHYHLVSQHSERLNSPNKGDVDELLDEVINRCGFKGKELGMKNDPRSKRSSRDQSASETSKSEITHWRLLKHNNHGESSTLHVADSLIKTEAYRGSNSTNEQPHQRVTAVGKFW